MRFSWASPRRPADAPGMTRQNQASLGTHKNSLVPFGFLLLPAPNIPLPGLALSIDGGGRGPERLDGQSTSALKRAQTVTVSATRNAVDVGIQDRYPLGASSARKPSTRNRELPPPEQVLAVDFPNSAIPLSPPGTLRANPPASPRHISVSESPTGATGNVKEATIFQRLMFAFLFAAQCLGNPTPDTLR